MSMDFTEFLRQLGADPRSRDPEFLRARRSSPEFQQAADEAEAFEARLERAVGLSPQAGVLEDIMAISREAAPAAAPRLKWRTLALAAGLLIAVGAAGITWKMNRSWDSVDQYLVEHYAHDGDSLLQKSSSLPATGVQAIFARFAMEATPELAGIISVIKYCPTPDGKGIHMVLNTRGGPITLIYMPETDVIDRQSIEFGGMQVLLVGLERGSAAIIGSGDQSISGLYAMVQESIIPAVNKA
jgi:hypothetical protein